MDEEGGKAIKAPHNLEFMARIRRAANPGYQSIQALRLGSVNQE